MIETKRCKMKTNEAIKLIGDKEFLDKIYQFSYRRCNASYEAEDLCSDIILAVISAVHNQEDIENFYAFVWVVARRVYADYSEKRNQARQTVSIENGDLLLAAKENEIDNFIEEAAEQEQIKKIFAEISFLSKAYREVMVLYYLDEMKVKDIALKLGINETTVKQRLFSARNTVRKEVETMNERKFTLKPISLAFIGTGNPTGNDPRTKAERILSQNIVYACKDKAKSAKELSEELCVPMPYIEDELDIQVKGQNGSYGLLRKEGEKYIANVIVVDNNEFDEVGKIYTKHLDELCFKLKEHINNNKEIFLNFPFLSVQTDIRFILWSLINESVWFIKERVDDILEEKFFKNVAVSHRKFTTVAVAIENGTPYSGRFYGCDGNETHDFCGYSYVFIRNIYGKRIDRHFYAGQDITNNEAMRITLKAIGGLPVKDLTENQKEIAAKAIECGFLRKSGDILEPQIVTIEFKEWEKYRNLLQGYYDSVEDICNQIALELHGYMISHIQKHLLNEYKSYNLLVAGINVLNDLIEKCIAENILTEPEKRIGAEGVLLVVEK